MNKQENINYVFAIEAVFLIAFLIAFEIFGGIVALGILRGAHNFWQFEAVGWAFLIVNPIIIFAGIAKSIKEGITKSV